MEKQYKVGIVGATGMVGQRFITLLENHPWFKLTVLAASGRSAGKTYEDAVGSRWAMTTPMPESVKGMMVQDASKVEEVAAQVDFIFCAVNMPKDEIKALEEAYAKAECPVVSNNSANRFTPDVPMVVPEINADHIEIIPAQRKRLGTKRGFIAVKSNCSLQSYVPALHPLMKEFGVNKALVCTYQAISGAGKTFDRMPEIVEQHHHNKLDAPSGTALMLADAINEQNDGAYHYVYDRSSVRQKRDPKEIGISSVRGGSIVGDHEVLFCGPDEVITLKHTAYSRSIFANGAINAAVYLAKKEPGLYNMGDLIASI